MLSFKWRTKISLFMSLVLLLGWMVPYGSHSAYASQEGVRRTDGIRMASGAYHSLLIKSNGTVVTWGDKSRGQADMPANLTDVITVSAGGGHSLALTSEGTVVAWGENGLGQTTIPEEAASGGAVAIAAGGTYSLALMSNGTVIGWGNNSNGQATAPAGMTDVVDISAGFEHSLALKSDGTVVAWGDSSSTLPSGLDNVVAISAGTYHSLALKSDGTVVAWGNNNDGQSTIPAELAAGGVTAISAGDHHSLALKADGTIVAWGDNNKGQLDTPADLTDVVAISTGWDYSLAQKSDGTVVAWGDDTYGQRTVPAGLSSPIKGSKIAAGVVHSLALKSDGTLAGWGSNFDGQLNMPAALREVAAIAAGNSHSLALRSNGTVVAWGYNYQGQTSVPAGLDGVVAISAGLAHSLALNSDGTVVAWGYNSNGQANVPVGLNDAVAIAAGGGHSLALKSDGTVVAWGFNNGGQINVPAGLNDAVAIAAGNSHSLALRSNGSVIAWGASGNGQISVPSGLSGVVAIAAGASYSLALKSDGTVVAWGNNNQDQINVPADLDGVVAIAAGTSHSLALKSDGSVVAWGDNSGGQTTVPGNADLSGLTMLEGDFTEPFDPSVTAYTYYYDGQSLPSVDVTPTLASTTQTDLYVDNELLASDGTKTISLAGATTDTAIPVRVEPYLLPGRTYTITLVIDSTEPEVQFGTNGQSTPVTSAASTVTVSDTQSGADAASLQYVWTQSTAVPNGGWTAFSNEDTLSQTTGDGDWYLHIRATDAVGNTVDAVSAPFVLDNTAPTATVTSSASGTVNAAFSATITFSEDVSELSEEDLVVGNGTASNVTSVSAASYTATITPTTSGQDVTVSVIADSVTDALGHGNTASNMLTLLYDTTKPFVSYGGFTDQQPFAAPPTEVSVSVSEAVYWIDGGAELTSANALPMISMTKDGEAFSAYTPSYDETSRTFTLSFGDALEDGVYEVNVAGGLVENIIHNTLDKANASFIVAVPAVANMAASTTSLPHIGGDTTVTIKGVNLTEQAVRIYVDGAENATATVISDTSATVTVSLPRNSAQTDRSYILTIYLNGVEVAGQSTTVTVNAAPASPPPLPTTPTTTTTLSSNADLADLNVDVSGRSLGLSPAFATGTREYTVETDAEQIELQVTPVQSNAVITLLGARIGETTIVPLAMGANVLTLTVQAENGTLKTYTLKITRVPISEEETIPSAPVCTFTDIENHWAQSQICEAAELGIVEGVDADNFLPNGQVTRTEFAVMLLRTLQIPISNEASALTFGDKDNIPAWARSAIQTVVAEGVLTGYPDGTLRPMQVVNRTEMATMVSRAMNWQTDRTASPFFSDDVRIPAWARTYVETAREHGIIVGRVGNQFQPDGLTTRAEAAVALLRLWKVLN
ncbi:RCC1 domain-containing protein [Paenibacillus sp. USHLN196]|uniref:RCC1 domain-containing protein n=1 Tax=Paenibacillus sp. USHLN196 TaxID=3081291 RepID=UPI0030195B25